LLAPPPLMPAPLAPPLDDASSDVPESLFSPVQAERQRTAATTRPAAKLGHAARVERNILG
jgi:hypothetical protein